MPSFARQRGRAGRTAPNPISAVPYLEEILKTDPATEVRREAAEALWHICEQEAA